MLQKFFSLKHYQGADPATAQFLFFGLDANYDPNIDDMHFFSEIVSYLEDGVRYWKDRGYHHPFQLLGARSILLHFWSSRDFAQVLGYTDYRNFEAVIEKARTAFLTAASASRIISLKSLK